MVRNKLLTLTFVRESAKVLLGYKKRGFGEGRWNGFGGKVEPGETIEEGAKRFVIQDNLFFVFNWILHLVISMNLIHNCIPDAKRGYYGFIIVVVRVRSLVRVRRDFLLVTYSPHFFLDFFHIWQVA